MKFFFFFKYTSTQTIPPSQRSTWANKAPPPPAHWRMWLPAALKPTCQQVNKLTDTCEAGRACIRTDYMPQNQKRYPTDTVAEGTLARTTRVQRRAKPKTLKPQQAIETLSPRTTRILITPHFWRQWLFSLRRREGRRCIRMTCISETTCAAAERNLGWANKAAFSLLRFGSGREKSDGWAKKINAAWTSHAWTQTWTARR